MSDNILIFFKFLAARVSLLLNWGFLGCQKFSEIKCVVIELNPTYTLIFRPFFLSNCFRMLPVIWDQYAIWSICVDC